MKKPKSDKPAVTQLQANNQIKSIVDRIERLEDEKTAISLDVREIFAEAKNNGYDIPALREILRIRKMEANKRAERESIIEIYMQALGMLSGTPLGNAAIEREMAH